MRPVLRQQQQTGPKVRATQPYRAAQVSRFAQFDKGTSRIEIHNRGPIRAASPIPRHPDAARITRAHKLRQQLENPESVDCSGFIFVWQGWVAISAAIDFSCRAGGEV
jgi:hypothetical protein